MPGRRVLVLEDEQRVRDAFVMGLERAGYSVVGFASGTDALERLPELTPDLILLDMMMPEMDGFEFLARLRANPASAEIPLLILSGLGDALARSIDTQGGRTLGVAGILTKPVHPEALIEAVRRAIGPPAAPPGASH